MLLMTLVTSFFATFLDQWLFIRNLGPVHTCKGYTGDGNTGR